MSDLSPVDRARSEVLLAALLVRGYELAPGGGEQMRTAVDALDLAAIRLVAELEAEQTR